MSGAKNRRYVNPENMQYQNVPVAPPNPQSGGQQNSQTIPVTQPVAPPTAMAVFPWANQQLLDPPSVDNSIPLPPYFRSTVNFFPSSKSVHEASKIPLGLVVNPSQVVEVPVIDYTTSKVPRCLRCAAYMSPYSTSLGDGSTWKCPFCDAVNNFDNFTYGSPSRQIEFTSPVYDIMAPPSFAVNPNVCPCFAFLLDLSIDAIQSGFTPHIITSIKASLSSMNQEAKVGLFTMGNRLTAYDFSRHTEFIICDISEPYLPTSPIAPLKDCIKEFEEVLDNLYANLGQLAANGQCFGSALLLASNALAQTGGVLIACLCGLPTIGPYALKERHADKEIQLIHLPEDGSGKFYREIGFKLNRNGVSVHLFNLKVNNKSPDLSIISVPCGLTGGHCFHYTEFNPIKLHNDLFVTMTSEYLWDSSMKLRCTKGIKINYLYSNCTIRENTVYYPVMSAHNAITFELGVDTEITTPQAYFQVAILWTNTQRQRMIRIFTFSIPTNNNPANIKSSVDEATLATVIAKQAAIKVLQVGPEESSLYVRRTLTAICSGGYKYSSLYHLMHSLLCSQLLRANLQGGADLRMTNVIIIRGVSLPNTLLYLYPRMYAIDTQTGELPLDSVSFAAGSVFLVHAHSMIYIWIAPSAPPETLQSIFGVQSPENIPASLPALQTPENAFAQELVQKCYVFSGKYIPTEIIPPGSPRESIFAEILVDLSNACGSTVASFITEMTSALH